MSAFPELQSARFAAETRAQNAYNARRMGGDHIYEVATCALERAVLDRRAIQGEMMASLPIPLLLAPLDLVRD